MSEITGYLVWFALGAALGGAYLWLVHLSVRALTTPGKRSLAVVPLLLRLAAAALTFYFAAQSGALSAIAALAGFLVVRTFTLQFIREG